MKTIRIVTTDSGLASRIQNALAGDDFHVEISEKVPIETEVVNQIDLIIWDNPFGNGYESGQEIFYTFEIAQSAGRHEGNPLPIIALFPEIEKKVFMPGIGGVRFDVEILRDSDPEEIRYLAKRLIYYASMPDRDVVYRI